MKDRNFGSSLRVAISFEFAFCTASSLIVCLMMMITMLMMMMMMPMLMMMLTTMQRQHIAVLRGDGGWCARLRNYSRKDYPTFLLQSCANLMLDKLQSFQSIQKMSKNAYTNWPIRTAVFALYNVFTFWFSNKCK